MVVRGNQEVGRKIPNFCRGLVIGSGRMQVKSELSILFNPLYLFGRQIPINARIAAAVKPEKIYTIPKYLYDNPIMPLQNLPLEILVTILRLVGSDSLRKQEACCLLVSKWWYELAESILLEDLALHANQLHGIPSASLTLLKKCLRRLKINLKPVSDQQVDKLDTDFNDVLSSILPYCTQLKTFTLFANGYFSTERPLESYTDYLKECSLGHILKVLPFSILSDLTIDTSGSEIQDKEHLCSQIALRIPSLRSLQLRMRCICPHVLEFDKSSKIESMIINLSLKEDHLLNAGFSLHCTEAISAYDLNDKMVTAATEIATGLSNIRMLRILCHKHPGLEMVTTDCINGSQMLLADMDDCEWDWSDDGPLYLPDDEPSDRDLFDSDNEDDYVL